jgi:hypothetical protein
MHHDTTVPPWWCPTCGSRLDEAMNVTGARAVEPGDLTLCVACAAVLVFDAARRPRLPAAEELEAYRANRERWAVVERAVALIQRRRLGRDPGAAPDSRPPGQAHG